MDRPGTIGRAGIRGVFQASGKTFGNPGTFRFASPYKWVCTRGLSARDLQFRFHFPVPELFGCGLVRCPLTPITLLTDDPASSKSAQAATGTSRGSGDTAASVLGRSRRRCPGPSQFTTIINSDRINRIVRT
eukprot:3167347-Rhodomonas_salina.1